MQDRLMKQMLYETTPSREYFQARRALLDRRDQLRKQLDTVPVQHDLLGAELSWIYVKKKR